MATTIKISDELWKILNDKKEKGESFEQVIFKIIKSKERIKK